MNNKVVVFLIINGIVLSILAMIGLYLLLSVRSAFRSDVEPNTLVRKSAGWNALLWALSFGLTFLSSAYQDTVYAYHAYVLNMQFCLLLIPALEVFMLRVLELNKTVRMFFISQMILPMVLLAGFIITHESWILNATIAYWVLIGIGGTLWCMHLKRAYNRRLKDLYSDMEHHDVKWAYRLLYCFLFYFAVFITAHTVNRYPFYYVLYAFCLALWFYVVYQVDSHEQQADFWLGAREAPGLEKTTENPSEGKGQTEDCVAKPERDLTWIGERLRVKCEETQLYLRPELNIDTLAAETGTNRTYISRYLASKGQSYYNYINTLRIEHAKQLLTAGNAQPNIRQIAYQCGYKNDTTFRRAFMEAEKCSPSEYLKQRR